MPGHIQLLNISGDVGYPLTYLGILSYLGIAKQSFSELTLVRRMSLLALVRISTLLSVGYTNSVKPINFKSEKYSNIFGNAGNYFFQVKSSTRKFVILKIPIIAVWKSENSPPSVLSDATYIPKLMSKSYSYSVNLYLSVIKPGEKNVG